ncbi:uncharacterized protein PITG_22966 [Phytophthora infestans T30-4]|uniref:Secreted protein n=1 Tax=Phytophthora infestans (strain T30-4) TaxID=403677 RepID=D0NKR7_PHYIT|nr:uncharacterized protein PITG_22966 [Phytophthora infestans T30-4]EEY60203.1 conserved hypothetical protein [Phytophthora infestans T30-4]|eukprot:XP_002900410.1 conserved hypothetical protein [Phytophthora infestans T30-4]
MVQHPSLIVLATSVISWRRSWGTTITVPLPTVRVRVVGLTPALAPFPFLRTASTSCVGLAQCPIAGSLEWCFSRIFRTAWRRTRQPLQRRQVFRVARPPATPNIAQGPTVLPNKLSLRLRDWIRCDFLLPRTLTGSRATILRTPGAPTGVMHITAVAVGIIRHVVNLPCQCAHRALFMVRFASFEGGDESDGALYVPAVHERRPRVVQRIRCHISCHRDWLATRPSVSVNKLRISSSLSGSRKPL